MEENFPIKFRILCIKKGYYDPISPLWSFLNRTALIYK